MDHGSDDDGSLSGKFGRAAKHVFSASMVIMMASMALPALGALADPTLADAGLALAEHYTTMFTAPFMEIDTLGQIAGNTVDGNFGLSYQWGNAHAGHVMSAADSGGMHLMPDGSMMQNQIASAQPISSSVTEAAAHAFSTPMEWFRAQPIDEIVRRHQEANAMGIPLEDYIASICQI